MTKVILTLLFTLFWLSNSSFKNRKDNLMTDIYKYKILKAGSITPHGWIEEQIERDLADGYIGVFDKVHPTVTHNVFVNQNRQSKRRIGLRKEWWSGEHEGYWKDAVIRMAFLTDNKKYKEKAENWINELLSNTGKEGYIGIYKDCDDKNCRFNHVRENGELWATSRMLMALLAYYEHTGEERVLEAAEKAAQLVMKNYAEQNYFRVTSRGGGISHGVGFFEIMEWLYRITNNKVYLNFSVKLYDDFNRGKMRDDDLQTKKLLEKQELFEKHGAHIAEGLFIPEFIAAIQPKDKLEQAADNVVYKLEEHLTPGGAMRCDEWIKGREGTADERYEYCGIAEMISPLNKMIAFTGDFDLANRIETMTFNAGQGARFPVLSALSYLTSDNRIHIRHRELIKRESYDAAHVAAACCVLNGGRLMPYYIEGMWMKHADDKGIAAMLYGPNEVETTINGTKVRIVENTNYPFSDKVSFTVHTEQPVNFTLTLRKPYASKTPNINGVDKADITDNKETVEIKREWKDKDSLEVDFNFEIERIDQPESKTVKKMGAYFKRGPLVFALPFDHDIDTVKEHGNSGFYRYKIQANDSGGWKFKLHDGDEFTFVSEINGETRRPWDEPVVKLKGTLRDKKNNKHEVDLVPMGNTIFRRVTFSKANIK